MNTLDPFAQARALEAEGRHLEARDIFSRLADQGAVEALTALGKSLLFNPPVDFDRGIDLITRATQSHNADALHLYAVLSAQGAGLPQDWGAALSYLAASAENGLEGAQNELRFLAAAQGDNWKTLRDGIDIPALLTPPRMQLMHTRPRIAVVEKFLSPDFCDWLVARAKPKMARAEMINEDGEHYIGSKRSNSWSHFTLADMDIAFVLLRMRIAAQTGLAVNGFEKTQVLHYAPGQQFSAHHDFLNPQLPAQRKMIENWGQRVVTFLVYLNDDYDGAETSFLQLNWRFRGNKGDAILFRNVDATGLPDHATQHAGTAPTRGEKWLLSQWIRIPPRRAQPASA